MAAAAEILAPETDESPLRIRPITVDEYHRMGEAGILGESEPVELLDGQLIAMPPEGPVHADVATMLLDVLMRTFGDRATIRVGNPVELSRISEPQPDIALVRRRAERYLGGHPKPSDVFLIVEVSRSSLPFDRSRKLHAYARAGIAEVWIVDLVHGHVETYAEPSATGYGVSRVAKRDESIAPRLFPDDAVPLTAFLP